jgi:two-component system, LytTR family, sensor kinase
MRPFKRLSSKTWMQIFGIWTLAALSMGTQMYLNTRTSDPLTNWFFVFIKQLPTWYLCALLTPVVMYFYDKFPLNVKDWKKNILKHTVVALGVLIFFSHLRTIAMSFILSRDIKEYSISEYLLAYISQIAWDFTIYAFIVVAIFAERNNASRKQKELYAAKIELRNKELQSELNLAQLEALKLQLNPHFLFNTLNTVSALIRVGDYSSAIRANARLGEFLRMTLHSGASGFVTLKEEMEFIDLYLGIEKLRFKDRLEFSKTMDKEALQVMVPHFILQPIIENAIKHGLAKQADAKVISVTTEKIENALLISIFNEGNLLPVNWLVEDNRGIGLQNVLNRLQKIYGNNFYFNIENSEKGRGVEVKLSIPIQSE